MDPLDLYFMRLLDRGAYKPRAIAHIEKLRAGLADGTIHARCQREGCCNLLFSHGAAPVLLAEVRARREEA
jgi:hypothetical protein